MSTRLIVLSFLFFLAPFHALHAQQNQPAPAEPDAATEPLPQQPYSETEIPSDPALQPGTALPYGAALEPGPEAEPPQPPPIYRLRPGVDPVSVLNALTKLLNRGANRRFFGLPEDANWRLEEGLRIAVYSDERDEVVPFLKAAAMQFSQATALPIELVVTRPLRAVAGAETARRATGANLEILFGARPVMGQLAGGAGMNRTVLSRFLEGRWPFGFVLPREEGWTGRVFIAREEPSEAVEAALVLALVWALGGVSLGDEMQGLVDPFSVEPTLTPLGHSVFSLMYHPDLRAGLPISEALDRAQQLVQLGRITAAQ